MNCLQILLFFGVLLSVNSSKALPKRLQECYSGNTLRGYQLPMNLREILDIIRKIEKISYSSMNLRLMTTSLLHRFKLDGVKYYHKSLRGKGILPFAATGYQREKQLLLEELIPSPFFDLPEETLSLEERCTLHRALSSTIWKDEADLCELAISGSEGLKSCSVESGVIATPYGTISLGTVITAIAAALEQQTVPIRLLLGPMDESVNSSKLIANVKINNVWASTLAGDLAEVVLNQGPLLDSRLTLGGTGVWDNSLRPILYLTTRNFDNFFASQAELIGGIDGLIIANNIENWINEFGSLRLSQILEMYYSDQGIAFNSSIKACNRKKLFLKIVEEEIIMIQQVFAASQVLSYRTSLAFIPDGALTKMVEETVATFMQFLDMRILNGICNKSKKESPLVETLVIFEGKLTRNYVSDFLTILLEELDVSMFHSRMGLLSGSSGQYLLNVTNSPSNVYESIANLPSTTSDFNMIKVLENVFIHLNDSWKKNFEKHTIGSLGQVIFFVVPSLEKIDGEDSIKLLIKNITSVHPDVRFFYFSSESKKYQWNSLLTPRRDRVITSISDVRRHFLSVPITMRPPLCNGSTIEMENPDQTEGYVQPSQTVTYRLDSFWRLSTRRVTLMVHGVAYGTIKVCSWNQWDTNGKIEDHYCETLQGVNDINMTDYSLCKLKDPCPTMYYEVQGISSLQRCKELDCNRPDDIRYLVRLKNICLSRATAIFSDFSFSLLITSLVVAMRFGTS